MINYATIYYGASWVGRQKGLTNSHLLKLEPFVSKLTTYSGTGTSIAHCRLLLGALILQMKGVLGLDSAL